MQRFTKFDSNKVQISNIYQKSHQKKASMVSYTGPVLVTQVWRRYLNTYWSSVFRFLHILKLFLSPTSNFGAREWVCKKLGSSNENQVFYKECTMGTRAGFMSVWAHSDWAVYGIKLSRPIFKTTGGIFLKLGWCITQI